MKKVLVITICSLFLFSCAAPEAVRKEASNVLIGECLDIFLDSTVGYYYQYMTQAGGDKTTSFALAYDTKDSQACAWAHWGEMSEGKECSFRCKEEFTYEELDALAIDRCEEFRKSKTSIKSQCKTYARGNNIVWGKEDASSIDFE